MFTIRYQSNAKSFIYMTILKLIHKLYGRVKSDITGKLTPKKLQKPNLTLNCTCFYLQPCAIVLRGIFVKPFDTAWTRHGSIPP